MMTEQQVMTREEKVSALKNFSDDELRETRTLIDDILRANEATRQRKALAEIRRIAKENGLNVSVGKPARKRGRPAKKAEARA